MNLLNTETQPGTPVAVACKEPQQERWVDTPAVDIHEASDHWTLWADMPGVSDSSVDVTIERNSLYVRGKSEAGPKDYQRRFTLGEGIDRDGVKASLHHGVLRVTLPKAASTQPRKILVQ